MKKNPTYYSRSMAVTATIATTLLINLGVVQAQPSINPAPSNDSLYQSFGAKTGLVKLMDQFMLDLLADARTEPFFKSVNQTRLKAMLVEQLCQEGGGPCVYSGRDMLNAHAGMGVEKSHFNALVEVLQKSMDTQGIPFNAQNKMLQRLAPMHREIIAK